MERVLKSGGKTVKICRAVVVIALICAACAAATGILTPLVESPVYGVEPGTGLLGQFLL